ncbi:MAG: M24 family metallopeptidase, partial [Elusimicrobiales bacterium]|nr:M24 family metallopeptidase [Elusimicrobiales bacterium]
ASIRVDMPLEEGFVMTAEPGVYFIEPLLKSEKTKEKYGSFINWPELEKWIGTGGCRQEDDILITKTGCEVLTKVIPKETTPQKNIY